MRKFVEISLSLMLEVYTDKRYELYPRKLTRGLNLLKLPTLYNLSH